eukprot:6491291-Amphidinium_carterae.1
MSIPRTFDTVQPYRGVRGKPSYTLPLKKAKPSTDQVSGVAGVHSAMCLVPWFGFAMNMTHVEAWLQRKVWRNSDVDKILNLQKKKDAYINKIQVEQLKKHWLKENRDLYRNNIF